MNYEQSKFWFEVNRKKHSYEVMQTGLEHLLEHIELNKPEFRYIKNSEQWFKNAGWFDLLFEKHKSQTPSLEEYQNAGGVIYDD